MDILGDNGVHISDRPNANSNGGGDAVRYVHNRGNILFDKNNKTPLGEGQKMMQLLIHSFKTAKDEFLHDWAIIKIPTFIILSLDFLGFLEKAIKSLNVDIQFSWFLILLVAINTVSGAVKSGKEGTFTFKKLGMGIFDKIWKYGRIILLVAILKNFPVGGIKNTIYDKIDIVIFVGIMAMEGKKTLVYVFGNKFMEKFSEAWTSISKLKKTKE